MTYPELLATADIRDIVVIAVDDDRTSLELIEATIEQDGVNILTAGDSRTGLELIAKHRPDIVISDLMMPGLTGMELLSETVRIDPTIEVVLLTAHYSTESAVEAIQKGASDYLNKPIETRKLRERIDQLIKQVRVRLATRRLDSELVDAHQFRGIIGRSPLMREVFARIERIAAHYRTVLVTGPTGAGKELVARALHAASPVSAGPFIVCNCGAIPESLVESELFGHVRGSFTGATQDRPGLFEAAHGGSILLDEIGEMPLAAQAKLLRVVQHQEVQRVGASNIRKINVRVIAATHRDLRAMLAERTFREDLFFRLCMVDLRLPALKERKEDLPLLMRYFLEHFSRMYRKNLDRFTRKAEIVLTTYDWPGNVRELEGVIGSAAMMADAPFIDVGDLPPQLSDSRTLPTEGVLYDLNLTLEALEVLHAHRVLANVGGDKVRAAETLGVSRATLYRLLAKPASRE